MADEFDTKLYLTPSQVADLFMVTAAAVRLWAEKGELKALMTPGGHRRFLKTDMLEFARSRNLHLKEIKSNKQRVLIIDDDKQFSGYLLKLLEQYSDQFDVDVANDGFNAGIKVPEFKPDIVLLDFMMPGLDGFQVCQHLMASKYGKSIRVIAMTGYHTLENIEQILAAGAEACLYKPIDRERLFKLLGITHKA